MADDLDENFSIEEEFLPEPRPQEVDDDNDNELVEEKPSESSSSSSSSLKKSQQRNRRKNIHEILELRKDELSRPAYPNDEFTKLLVDYASKKLSSVERNTLDLGADTEAMSKKISKMLLKRGKTHSLEIGLQFKKKIAKKLR